MARGSDLEVVQEIPEIKVSGTMKAAIITAPGEFTIEDVQIPRPGPNQIRVQVEGCGISISDLRPWKGQDNFHYPLAPGAPGHEGWGIVDEVGEKVTGFASGEKVAFLSSNAFAEYDIVDAGNLIKLPPTMKSLPFTAEPLAQVVNILKKCEIKKGQTIGIVGLGFQGLLLAQMVKKIGAKVVAVSRRESALELAKTFGVDELILMDNDENIIKKAKEATNGRLCEIVIEITGKEWPLNIAAHLVASKGKLIIGGVHLDGNRNINMYLWNMKGFEMINAYEIDPNVIIAGMKEGLKMVLDNEVNLYNLYTHTFSIEKLGTGLQMASERPEGFVKGLLIF